MDTMYYLDICDNILCSTCGESEENAINLKNTMHVTLTCHKCKECIPFVGQIELYVRPVKRESSTVYKFFRKVGNRKYELHPDYLDYGYLSRARAERCAREIERSASGKA